MSTKDSTPREWPDPTDFGLPFVEVTPLSSAKPSAKVVQAAPFEQLSKKEAAPKPPKKEEKETKTSKPITPPVSSPKAKKPRSRAWVGFVVIGFLAVVSVIIWQLQSGDFALPAVNKEVPSITPLTLTESNTVAPVDTTNASGMSGIDSAAAVAAANSGTTIAPSVSGSLIRVNSKETKPRFFIIIGSFGSEEESIRFMDGMQGIFPQYHLIAPYEGSKNFRLAVGKYTSWKEASSELERAKSAYPKDLWILNY